MAGSGRKVWAADEVLAAADLQDYIQDQVVFVFADAAARTSGILAPTEGMVSYLKDTNALSIHTGSAWVEVVPNVGTAGTYTKVTTDAKGRVTSGTTLDASDIVSGKFPIARLNLGRNYVNASTNSNGDIYVAHGLSSTPPSVIVTGGIGGAIPERRTYAVHTVDSGGFTVRVYRQDTGTVLASNPVDFYWMAYSA